MAKKTLALAFFLLSAGVLSAAKCVPGLEIMSGVSYCSIERSQSISIASLTGVELLLEREGKMSFSVSLGMEGVHSLLNLSRFSSAGDYKGLYVKAGISDLFLSFNAGVLLIVPEAYSGSVIPAFVSDAVLKKDAHLGENFVLRAGAGVSVVLGRSFRSYRVIFGVMGLWR